MEKSPISSCFSCQNAQNFGFFPNLSLNLFQICKFWVKISFCAQNMAKSKKSVKITSKKAFLLSGLTSGKAVTPQNPFHSLSLVILHSFGYGKLEKGEKLRFWQLSIWGFFHPWANCAMQSVFCFLNSVFCLRTFV